jgi:hypothetical protein
MIDIGWRRERDASLPDGMPNSAETVTVCIAWFLVASVEVDGLLW